MGTRRPSPSAPFGCARGRGLGVFAYVSQTNHHEKEKTEMIVKEEQCCWFRKITPTLVSERPENMKYQPFDGMYLITESTDTFEEGSVVTEVMVFWEQMRQQRIAKETERA